MYIALTCRPDLSASVNYYSQFQSCPTEVHWTYLKHVLRYLKGSLNIGLIYQARDNACPLAAFCDANWGNDITDRKSVTGYLFKVFGSVTT